MKYYSLQKSIIHLSLSSHQLNTKRILRSPTLFGSKEDSTFVKVKMQ
jgi:hypothetical protein